MFSRPAYAPLLIGVWLVPLLIGVIVGPWPPFWATFFPEPYPQALALQDAPYFDTSAGCYSSAAQSWREIVASSHPTSWFKALAREGRTPAARLYGLVGLASVAPRMVPQILQELGPEVLRQEAGFWDGVASLHPSGAWGVPLQDLARPDSLQRFAHVLAQMTSRAEC